MRPGKGLAVFHEKRPAPLRRAGANYKCTVASTGGAQMSRGLGSLQSEIKEILTILWRRKLRTQFADIRACLLYADGGEVGEDTLAPTYERSLWRALTGLIARGDVVVIGGRGTSGSPRQFATVEDFARLSGKKVRDAAHAKEIAAGVPLELRPQVVAELRSHRAAARRGA
jgi:hypothetical protein